MGDRKMERDDPPLDLFSTHLSVNADFPPAEIGGDTLRDTFGTDSGIKPRLDFFTSTPPVSPFR
jgi:hypothetical protein